jgi:hypothetical protein
MNRSPAARHEIKSVDEVALSAAERSPRLNIEGCEVIGIVIRT